MLALAGKSLVALAARRMECYSLNASVWILILGFVI